MKTLDKDAVRIAAEYLIEQFGNTTTLDVKNRLRNTAYQAFQADVSNFMDIVAREENFTFTLNGSYKVYRFGPDTAENLKKYLEKGTDFWEVEVQGKNQNLAFGQIGTNGEMQSQTFSSNRKAISNAKNQLNLKLQEGFAEAKDTRLPFHLRQKYGKYFNQKAVQCKIGFFDVLKVEKQEADFIVNGEQLTGYFTHTKIAGYEFVWTQNLSQILDYLQDNTLDLLKTQYTQAKLLGEKRQTSQAKKPDSTNLDAYEKADLKDTVQIESLEAKRENLYQIELVFETGEKAILSKFELNLESELLPLAYKIFD